MPSSPPSVWVGIQEGHHRLHEQVRLLEVHEVPRAGDDDPSCSRDASFDGASMRMHIGDILGTDENERRHTDLAESRKRGLRGKYLVGVRQVLRICPEKIEKLLACGVVARCNHPP